MPNASTDNHSMYRCTVVQWMSNSTPTANDIYENVTFPLLSAYDHTNRYRFRVLLDQHGELNAGGVNGPSVSKFNKIIKIPKKLVNFDGATSNP